MHKLERVGIKEDVIIEQVIRINNEQRQEVRDVYKGRNSLWCGCRFKMTEGCFGEDLVDQMDKIRRDDLRHGLKGLMRPPAEYAARELRKAMRGPGTDEETLIELLCTRTNAGIEAIKESYADTHGRDLESDIGSETRGDFRCLLTAILQAQRQEDEDADEDAAMEDAQELYDAGEDRWGTDEATFTFILARRSWIQLRWAVLLSADLFTQKAKSHHTGVRTNCRQYAWRSNRIWVFAWLAQGIQGYRAVGRKSGVLLCPDHLQGNEGRRNRRNYHHKTHCQHIRGKSTAAQFLLTNVTDFVEKCKRRVPRNSWLHARQRHKEKLSRGRTRSTACPCAR